MPEEASSADLELMELGDGQSNLGTPRAVRDLEAVYDIPVTVSAVLGKAVMFRAVSGRPPIAYTSERALAAAIAPNQ